MRRVCTALALLFIAYPLFSQKVNGRLHLEQGKTIQLQVDLKNTVTQQGGGQAIDLVVSGTALHSYTVTNNTGDNTTLHHDVQRIRFDFEGMGQKRSFDSQNENDMNGPWGPSVAEMLGKRYDMIIDTLGRTLLVNPEGIKLQQSDDRFAIVSNMLRELIGIIYPPQKGTQSFFKVLPDYAVTVGDKWSETVDTEHEKSDTEYTLTSITDTTLLIDFQTKAITTNRSQLMGTPISSIMNSTVMGKIIIDRKSGIIREKISNIESTGTTEAMGATTPISAVTIIAITTRH